MEPDEDDFEAFEETSSLLSRVLRREARGRPLSVSTLNRLLELEGGDEEEVASSFSLPRRNSQTGAGKGKVCFIYISNLYRWLCE